MCYVGCDNIWRPKNGGSYLFCFIRLVLHASELIMFIVYCSKLMLNYFGISNMYVNHAIVVKYVFSIGDMDVGLTSAVKH